MNELQLNVKEGASAVKAVVSINNKYELSIALACDVTLCHISYLQYHIDQNVQRIIKNDKPHLNEVFHNQALDHLEELRLDTDLLRKQIVKLMEDK